MPRCREILAAAGAPLDRLQKLCEFLQQSVPHYDWFGFYLAVPERRELVLGPYTGLPTDHVRIPYGTGVCGRVAEELQTLMIDDVRAETNYLSCSIHVRSEIVVPVMRQGRMVAEIDIDSHTPGAFTSSDRDFLEALAEACEPLIPDLPGQILEQESTSG